MAAAVAAAGASAAPQSWFENTAQAKLTAIFKEVFGEAPTIEEKWGNLILKAPHISVECHKSFKRIAVTPQPNTENAESVNAAVSRIFREINAADGADYLQLNFSPENFGAGSATFYPLLPPELQQTADIAAQRGTWETRYKLQETANFPENPTGKPRVSICLVDTMATIPMLGLAVVERRGKLQVEWAGGSLTAADRGHLLRRGLIELKEELGLEMGATLAEATKVGDQFFGGDNAQIHIMSIPADGLSATPLQTNDPREVKLAAWFPMTLFDEAKRKELCEEKESVEVTVAINGKQTPVTIFANERKFEMALPGQTEKVSIGYGDETPGAAQRVIDGTGLKAADTWGGDKTEDHSSGIFV